jgi:gentisate 1,2-dioxygenase
MIGGKRYDWSKSDIFVVPSWAMHEHANASERDDAVLFSFSDIPSMVALGLYREENLVDNGGHQKATH